MRLCVISCGKKKIWDVNPQAGPAKAKEAYVGRFVKICIQYAEKFYPDNYVILSAKYGFLFPEEFVPENYNVTFKNLKTNLVNIEELIKQAQEKKLMKYDEIVVIGGSQYADIVKKVFAGKQIFTPLRGLGGIGVMMSAIKKAIREGKELR